MVIMNFTKTHFLIIGLILIIFAGVFIITWIKPAQKETISIEYYAFEGAKTNDLTASFGEA
jgi:hypothetical protein